MLNSCSVLFEMSLKINEIDEVSSDSNNNNSDVKSLNISEILKLVKEEKLKYLAEQNWKFYKDLKELPDEQASELYEVNSYYYLKKI